MNSYLTRLLFPLYQERRERERYVVTDSAHIRVSDVMRALGDVVLGCQVLVKLSVQETVSFSFCKIAIHRQ